MNLVDPSGMRQSEGGDDGWTHPVHGGGGGGAAVAAAGGPSYWDRCALPVSVFFVNLFFAALGVALPMTTAEHLAWNLVTHWKWGTVTAAVLQDIGLLIQILVDVGLITLQAWISSIDWMSRVGFSAKIGGALASNARILNVATLVMAGFIVYLSLQSRGCA